VEAESCFPAHSVSRYADMRSINSLLARQALNVYTDTVRRSLMIMGGYECQVICEILLIMMVMRADGCLLYEFNLDGMISLWIKPLLDIDCLLLSTPCECH
jgi:hypothetical protein